METIRRNSSSSTEKTDALILYFLSADNLSTTNNMPNVLTPAEIDTLVDGLDEIEPRKYDSIFLMSNSTNNGVGGAWSKYNSSKEIVNITVQPRSTDSNISAAALISDQTINNTNRIKMLILDEPTAYKNFNPSDSYSIVSPIIVLGVDKRNSEIPIDISLYFQDLENDTRPTNGRYACTFLNTTTSKWSDFGCTEPLLQ